MYDVGGDVGDVSFVSVEVHPPSYTPLFYSVTAPLSTWFKVYTCECLGMCVSVPV